MGLGSGVEAGGVDKERGANGNHAQNSVFTEFSPFHVAEGCCTFCISGIRRTVTSGVGMPKTSVFTAT